MERKCPGASSRCWHGIGSLSGIRNSENYIKRYDHYRNREESDLIADNTAPACIVQGACITPGIFVVSETLGYCDISLTAQRHSNSEKRRGPK